ncbi:MAG: Panacea domain-containing protein [Planctomycetia bacterium]
MADCLLNYFCRHGDPITNLKLQKILYYAQAWHLALYDSALFDDDFQAWVHGPVQPDVYFAFRDNGYRPIVTIDCDQGRDECDAPEDEDFSECSAVTGKHLQEVVDIYGGMSAIQLEDQTHSEQPWIEARGGTPRNEPSTALISKTTMRDFYRAKLA